MLDFIQESFERLVDAVDLKTKRYLYPKFNIDNRLIGLLGPRGVGKTTLLLQFIKEHYYNDKRVFYFSADQAYFSQTTLIEFINDLYHHTDYRIFFIDEIQKYQNWNQELKNLYDSFPNLKFIFSGSSMLNLVKGSYDLSRRVKLYELSGMSFREYLNFTNDDELPSLSFESLLNNTDPSSHKIALINKVKGHFKNYLAEGYYPFIFEDRHDYYARILRIVDKTIYEDIAEHYNLKTPHLHLFKKLLSFMASIPPGELNTNNIANKLGIANQTAFHYLTILQEVGLLRFIYPFDGGHRGLSKPHKSFLNNTSLLHALNANLGYELDKGNLRELFFLQSIQNAGVDIFTSNQGDYQTRKVIFEIGGKNKTRAQIKNAKLPAYLIKDDILLSSKGVIPLIYLGFLY